MTLSAVTVGRGWVGTADPALGSGRLSGLVWGSSLSQGLSAFAAGSGGIVVEVGVCGVCRVWVDVWEVFGSRWGLVGNEVPC